MITYRRVKNIRDRLVRTSQEPNTPDKVRLVGFGALKLLPCSKYSFISLSNNILASENEELYIINGVISRQLYIFCGILSLELEMKSARQSHLDYFI